MDKIAKKLTKLANLEIGISDIVKPFQYFDFAGYVSLPGQKCKYCQYITHDRREALIEHLKKHGIFLK